MQIPFVSLTRQHTALREAMLEKTAGVLDSAGFILGKENEEFEEAYSRYSGVKYTLGTSNGTDALKLCLRALDIGNGDEVILPANTFMATALAVTDVGATPILADPDPHSMNLTAAAVAEKTTSGTKAVIPVHLYGQPCDMDSILHHSQARGIAVVEDNAQAQGAYYGNRRTGSLGSINATSFYPTKNLGTLGDAGAVTTDNADLAHKVRLLRNLGSHQKYHHEILGYNARMDTLQAAFLQIKLPFLDVWNAERKKIAARYTEQLQSCTGLVLPNPAHDHVFHLYVVQARDRDRLQAHLLQKNIQTLIHYPVPIHLQPAFRHLGYVRGDFPVTERLADALLSLPLYIGMTDAEIDYVCGHIRTFYT